MQWCRASCQRSRPRTAHEVSGRKMPSCSRYSTNLRGSGMIALRNAARCSSGKLYQLAYSVLRKAVAADVSCTMISSQLCATTASAQDVAKRVRGRTQEAGLSLGSKRAFLTPFSSAKRITVDTSCIHIYLPPYTNATTTLLYYAAPQQRHLPSNSTPRPACA